jgi:DNA-binding PadR family transcriptional regulator
MFRRMPSAQQVRTVRLTTTEAAVLALLAIEGERSGYDLTKAVERAIGHIWSPAKSGLYATLPRLAKEGLAHKRGRLYRISTAGRAALDEWLATVEPGARETFFLKLFVGGLTTPEMLAEHVEQFVADTEERLDVLRGIVPTNSNTGHDWYHRHLLQYGIEQAERELEWAARVGRALRRGPR